MFSRALFSNASSNSRLGTPTSYNLRAELLQIDLGHLLVPDHLVQPGKEERRHHPNCGYGFPMESLRF